MKKFLNIFFVTLGVIFLILILFGIYFYIADPLNIRHLLSGSGSQNESYNIDKENSNLDMSGNVSETEAANINSEENSMLSESQAQTLEAFGIDTSSLPSEISPEQEACFVEALGQARVDEIKAGDSPTMTEIFIGSKCIE